MVEKSLESVEIQIFGRGSLEIPKLGRDRLIKKLQLRPGRLRFCIVFNVQLNRWTRLRVLLHSIFDS